MLNTPSVTLAFHAVTDISSNTLFCLFLLALYIILMCGYSEFIWLVHTMIDMQWKQTPKQLLLQKSIYQTWQALHNYLITSWHPSLPLSLAPLPALLYYHPTSSLSWERTLTSHIIWQRLFFS
jgi:hypothetical protein